MIVEKSVLREDNEKVFYTRYLLDNSPEIEANRKRPAMIICPGGGYLLTSDREAEPVAMFFLNQGYQAFVLRYITADKGSAIFPNSLLDLCKTIAEIREHADEWHVDPDKIAIIGFSAGANLCACLATMWHQAFLKLLTGVDNQLLKPNAVILGYPLIDYPFQKMMTERDPSAREVIPFFGSSKYDFMIISNHSFMGQDLSDERLREVSPITHVSDQTPPVFIWHTATDDLVYVGNSLNFARSLEDHKVPFELHIFEKGPHGMSLANHQTTGNFTDFSDMDNPDVAVWTDLASRFLRRHFSV